jgi:hypothetical protein
VYHVGFTILKIFSIVLLSSEFTTPGVAAQIYGFKICLCVLFLATVIVKLFYSENAEHAGIFICVLLDKGTLYLTILCMERMISGCGCSSRLLSVTLAYTALLDLSRINLTF